MEPQKTDLKKRSTIKAGSVGLLALLVAGCGLRTQVVYVPPGDAVKLRETLKGVDVWVKTKEGEIIAGQADLFEGWY